MMQNQVLFRVFMNYRILHKNSHVDNNTALHPLIVHVPPNQSWGDFFKLMM